MGIFAKSGVITCCMVTVLVAGCGGDGDPVVEDNGDMSGSAFIGRWQVSDPCVGNTDASGADTLGWHKEIFEFTATGEFNLINYEYLDRFCILNWNTTLIPGFSWTGRGTLVYADGTRVNRLTMNSNNPKVPTNLSYKIALATRNSKLCFSKNVEFTASSFGIASAVDSVDTVDFNRCLVSSQ